MNEIRLSANYEKELELLINLGISLQLFWVKRNELLVVDGYQYMNTSNLKE